MIKELLARCGTVLSWKRVQGASGKLQVSCCCCSCCFRLLVFVIVLVVFLTVLVVVVVLIVEKTSSFTRRKNAVHSHTFSFLTISPRMPGVWFLRVRRSGSDDALHPSSARHGNRRKEARGQSRCQDQAVARKLQGSWDVIFSLRLEAGVRKCYFDCC